MILTHKALQAREYMVQRSLEFALNAHLKNDIPEMRQMLECAQMFREEVQKMKPILAQNAIELFLLGYHNA